MFLLLMIIIVVVVVVVVIIVVAAIMALTWFLSIVFITAVSHIKDRFLRFVIAGRG
jgi:hypothetical protein